MIASTLEHFFKMCFNWFCLIISAKPLLSSKLIVKTCKERGSRGTGDHWLALREWRCAVLQTVWRQRPIKKFKQKIYHLQACLPCAGDRLHQDPKLLDCLHKCSLLSCSLVNHLIIRTFIKYGPPDHIRTCINYGSNLMKAIRSKPPAGQGLPQQPT